MDRYVVRIADGEFGAGGGPGAVLTVTDPTRYTVVVTGRTVDPRTEKWCGRKGLCCVFHSS